MDKNKDTRINKLIIGLIAVTAVLFIGILVVFLKFV